VEDPDVVPGGASLYALTPNTVELIHTLGALPPPRRARPGRGPHTLDQEAACKTQTLCQEDSLSLSERVLY